MPIHKEKTERYRRESVRLVPTADDWYPCFFEPIDEKFGSPMVRGKVYLASPDAPARWRSSYWKPQWFVRISFWGNDDTGIEQDFYFDHKNDALEQYERCVTFLGNIAIVCRDDLLRLGFVHA